MVEHRSQYNMSTTARLEWKHPMLLDEASLGKIEAILKRSVGKPTITVSCADNTEHEFTSVGALAKYENSKGSRIESIRFCAVKDGDWSKHARVSLTSYSYRTLEIEVKGTQATAPKARDELAEVCEGIRVWYWPIYRIDFVSLLFGGLFVLWLATSIIVRIQKGALILSNATADDVAGVIVAVAIISIGSAIHFLRDRLFPRFTVLIGQEIRRHKTLEKVQWGIVIGFGVSLLAGIATVAITGRG
jgi:hypothetical protein